MRTAIHDEANWQSRAVAACAGLQECKVKAAWQGISAADEMKAGLKEERG